MSQYDIISFTGGAVLGATIQIPRSGIWHADLVLPAVRGATLPTSGRLFFGSQIFTGTVTQSGIDAKGQIRLRLIGGKAKYNTVVAPKGYRSIPAGIVLRDIVADCGETGIASTADQSLLSTQLNAWSRFSMKASRAIHNVLQSLPNNPVWRVLSDGTLWIGYESWTEVTLPDATIIETIPERNRITIASNDPLILPGNSFKFTLTNQSTQTAKISYVQHDVGPSMVRTTLLTENL